MAGSRQQKRGLEETVLGFFLQFVVFPGTNLPKNEGIKQFIEI